MFGKVTPEQKAALKARFEKMMSSNTYNDKNDSVNASNKAQDSPPDSSSDDDTNDNSSNNASNNKDVEFTNMNKEQLQGQKNNNNKNNNNDDDNDNAKCALNDEKKESSSEMKSESTPHVMQEEEKEKESATSPSVPANQKASEIMEIDSESEYVEVTNIRLFSLDEVNFDALKACTVLSLRKNLIHELSPLPLHVTQKLVEIDFFDNKIKRIGDFFCSATEHEPIPNGPLVKRTISAPFTLLSKLDLSYNQLRKIDGLDSLAGSLRELYLVENKIKNISGLEVLVHLELLELGGNRIREIGNGLNSLVNLKSLWLGKNKITEIASALHSLRNLEILSLQANRITSIQPENFLEGANPHLREVYLSENGITSIEHLPVHTLKVLDFSFNPISTLNTQVLNPENIPLLEEFWLTDGKIKDWKEVEKFTAFAATLRTIYLERNPIEDDKRYRDKVYMYLPFITQIDSWPVVNKENLEADRSIQRRNVHQ